MAWLLVIKQFRLITPGFPDTPGLFEIPLLELYRRNPTDMVVALQVAERLDVIEHVSARFFAVAIDTALDAFPLQQLKPALATALSWLLPHQLMLETGSWSS